MVRTRRALKRAKSIQRTIRQESNFSYIVRKQKNLCWYCNEHMGTDVTKEHILSQMQGGTDFDPPGNLVAAHSACNLVVGHLEVPIKYKLRDVCHSEGRDAMFRLARQLRRAQAREAFVSGIVYKRW